MKQKTKRQKEKKVINIINATFTRLISLSHGNKEESMNKKAKTIERDWWQYAQ
jgi:hypothetical protein